MHFQFNRSQSERLCGEFKIHLSREKFDPRRSKVKPSVEATYEKLQLA